MPTWDFEETFSSKSAIPTLYKDGKATWEIDVPGASAKNIRVNVSSHGMLEIVWTRGESSRSLEIRLPVDRSVKGDEFECSLADGVLTLSLQEKKKNDSSSWMQIKVK